MQRDPLHVLRTSTAWAARSLNTRADAASKPNVGLFFTSFTLKLLFFRRRLLNFAWLGGRP